MTALELIKSSPWLGTLPTHWRKERLRWFIQDITQGWSPEAEDREPTANEWGVLKLNAVQRGTFNAAAVKTLPLGLEAPSSLQLRPGDVLVTRANTPGQVGDVCFVFTARPRVILSDLIYRLRLHEGRIDGRFLSYFLLTPMGRRQIECDARGTSNSMVKISQEHIKNWLIPVPPLAQQNRIADYLDRETARLDRLVAAKERVLGLLAEKRRALITRVVTRGLDTLAPLRDSGIPWLGEIPAHWRTERIGWLLRERDERGAPDLPLLEVSINSGVVLREFSEERIESTAADFNIYKVARRGDIVFNKMRMWQGAVGVAPQDGLVSPDYVVAAPVGQLMSDFAGLLFRTDIFSAECARRSHGIVWDRLRLYWEEFREIELPLPPLSAQCEIAAHLAEATARLDALGTATERSITLLKERRTALISAAVTGQIDVEDAA